mmetsp:Transcript_2813/g.6327  ORF Transcript_2813/g.6327 Transcript_2813/m.6327 type:complete len:249 (+) Transcript_2813:142-888(+)
MCGSSTLQLRLRALGEIANLAPKIDGERCGDGIRRQTLSEKVGKFGARCLGRHISRRYHSNTCEMVVDGVRGRQHAPSGTLARNHNHDAILPRNMQGTKQPLVVLGAVTCTIELQHNGTARSPPMLGEPHESVCVKVWDILDDNNPKVHCCVHLEPSLWLWQQKLLVHLDGQTHGGERGKIWRREGIKRPRVGLARPVASVKFVVEEESDLGNVEGACEGHGGEQVAASVAVRLDKWDLGTRDDDCLA